MMDNAEAMILASFADDAPALGARLGEGAITARWLAEMERAGKIHRLLWRNSPEADGNPTVK